jgi:hypothetical protein
VSGGLVVSEILGHVTVALTLDRHAHAVLAMQEAAVSRLAGLALRAFSTPLGGRVGRMWAIRV